MRISRVISLLIIFLCTHPAFSNSPPPTWNPYSPYTGYQSNVDEVHIGFGDWCTITEGPHPGIDFGDPNQNSGTQVYSPCGTAGTVEWAGHFIDNNPQDPKGMVVCVAKPGEDWGWGVAHLDPGINPMQYDIGGVQAAFAPMEVTFDMSQSNPDWRHVQLYWIHRNPPSGMGFYNPFNYIAGNLNSYDAVCFGSPQYIENSLLPDNGVYFSPDEVENPNLFNFAYPMTWMDFQEVVFGNVDVSARPYSAFQDDIENDTCGVNTVGYKILQQNPYTGDYEDLDESSISIFGGNYRLLVSIDDGEMIEGDSDEYRAVYLDGNVIGSGQTQAWAGFNSSYIVTNSGTQSMGLGTDGFNSGWDNVWTDQYNRDADWSAQEFLRGAWDTRLGNSSDHTTASINNQAVFPDGRYAFAVKALSQGTAFLDPAYQQWSERIMPCEDPHIENSPVTGVVVDNYLPYVDCVIVYSLTGGLDPPRLQMIYAAGWDENTENNTAELIETVYGYLPLEEQIFDQLWVAVKYSEPMDTGDGDVWITAEMCGQQRWNSASDGEFIPEDTQSNWIPKFGSLETEELSGGMWQLYRFTGSDWPREYNGCLTLHVKRSSEHPVDYGENGIDGDPSTIAYPRNADGSWSGTGYETEDDASCTWGECEWSVFGSGTSDGYFYAMIGNTLVQTVLFTEIGLGKAETDDEYVHVVNANIPYNCGAFVSFYTYTPDGRVWYHPIRVIDGDGNWVGQTNLFGPTDKGQNIVYSQTEFIMDGSENEPCENQYYWIRHRYVFYHTSQARYESVEEWWGFNGHTGMWCGDPCGPVVSNDLYFGDYCPAWSNSGQKQWFYINYNEPESPEYDIEDGWEIPVYYVHLGNPNPYPRGVMYAPTQIPSDVASPSEECILDTFSRPEVYTFSLLPLMPNPATSSVAVHYSVEESGNYEIEVYDLSGRIHAELLHGEILSGIHSLTWDLYDNAGVNLPAGVYLVRLAGCNREEIQRLVVLE